MRRWMVLQVAVSLAVVGCAIPCGVNIHRQTLLQYEATARDLAGIQFFIDVDAVFDYRSPTTNVKSKDVEGGRGTFAMTQERTEGAVIIRPCTPCALVDVDEKLTRVTADFGDGILLDFEADRSGIYYLATREFTHQGRVYTLRHWRRQNLRVDAAFLNRLRINLERTVAPGRRVE